MEVSSLHLRYSLIFNKELSVVYKMLKLVVISVLLQCCLAAPVAQNSDYHEVPRPFLTRPAPINPDILGDPKPNEKITPITNDVSQSSKEPSPSTPLPGPLNLQNYNSQKTTDRPIVGHVKRDIPAPLEVPEEHDKSTSVEPLNPQSHHEATADPQATADVKAVKRDIPVPSSIPEKQLSEASEKSVVSENDKETSAIAAPKEGGSEEKSHSPSTLVHPIPVSELFGNKKIGADSSS